MKMLKFKIEKLIRDKIIDLMLSQKATVNSRILDNHEFLIKLKQKLVEEAKETLETTNEAELVEEMADVFEVLYALMDSLKINQDAIEKCRIEKKLKKGGFDKKIYVESVELEENNKAVELFKNQPQKYPPVVS